MIRLLITMFLSQVAGLQPGTGIVTGSVRFTDGQPAREVRVAAIATDDPDGTTMLSIAETDSAGRYRLSNVPEGAYYIVAGRLSNLTYYPGTGDVAQAKEIAVEAARTVPGVDFTLPISTSARVSRSSSVRRSEVVAYLQIDLETDLNRKLKMLLSFQNDFPDSDVLPEIFISLMDVYSQHRDGPAVAYSQKLLREDAETVALLIETSKALARNGNLPSAIEYADRAASAAAVLKSRRPPAPYAGPAFESWVRSIEFRAAQQRASLVPRD